MTDSISKSYMQSIPNHQPPLLSKDISCHILLVGPNYKNPRGGISQVLNIYSQYFASFKFIATWTQGSRIKKLWCSIIAIIKLIVALSSSKIKIVHVHGASNASFWRKSVVIYLAKLFGKKTLFHLHGGAFDKFSQHHHRAVQRLFNHCDVVVAISASWKHFLENNFKCKHIIIIPNITEYPQGCNHTPSGKPQPATLLFLGLVCKQKGVFDLLDAIALHKEEWIGKLKLIIGGNGETEKLQECIKKQHLEEIVDFKGWVTGTQKTELFTQAQGFILPSHNEGLPLSILEAMTYGLPILATPVGGIPEIVTNNYNGFLFEEGNTQAIYQALHTFTNMTEDERAEMGINSKQRVKAHMPQAVIKQLKQLYEQLLN